MSWMPKPQEIYKHFKGNLYQIITLARHSETGEILVVYQALYGSFQIYARPLEMFTSRVDKSKYPEVKQQYRFELQDLTEKPQEEFEKNRGDSVKQYEDSPEEEVSEVDPLILEFLDADSHEQRLNILAALHHRITDSMITTMAVVCDIEVPEGELEERYQQLKNCLLMRERFEIRRK